MQSHLSLTSSKERPPLEELRIEANGNLGPIDSSRIPRYAGAATYARLPRLDQVAKADVTVVGVPFDSGVSYRPGARFGANHVREASRLLRPYNPAWDVSPFENIQVADAGDMAVNPFHINEAIETIQQNALDLTAAGSKLLTLGGDHTIALPAAAGRCRARRAGPLPCSTSMPTWTPGTPTSAPNTPMARPSAARWRKASWTLKPSATSAPAAALRQEGSRRRPPLWVWHCHFSGRLLSGRAGNRRQGPRPDRQPPLYISVDIDVLDPRTAPGTGTPEAGGITSRETPGESSAASAA
ncbi:agmatinase (plasmid) [Arthrobacter sp. NicSoilB11]|nr:agmatinase [Arthrobacter sp. NicSoilB11]